MSALNLKKYKKEYGDYDDDNSNDNDDDDDDDDDDDVTTTTTEDDDDDDDSVATKQSEGRYQTSKPYNNDAEEVEEEDTTTTTAEEDMQEEKERGAQSLKTKAFRKKKKSGMLRLPGGIAMGSSKMSPLTRAISNKLVGSIIKVQSVHPKVLSKIRDYMDVLFGSANVALKGIYNFKPVKPTETILYMIPNVVRAILWYNNLTFQHVRLHDVPSSHAHLMVEALWFDYNIPTSTLDLFFCRDLADELTLHNKPAEVIITSGAVDLHEFNPFRISALSVWTPSHPPEFSIQKCLVLCDHVAQHIIHQLYCKPEDHTALHDGWCQIGTTLSSMFDKTRSWRVSPDASKRGTPLYTTNNDSSEQEEPFLNMPM